MPVRGQRSHVARGTEAGATQDGRTRRRDTRRDGESEPRPLGDEHQFAALMRGMVADLAPRVFAIVQEYGERVDGRVVAWGMAFDDHADALDVDGGAHVASRSAEDVLRGFARSRHVTPHLVWVDPAAATRDVGDERVGT